MNQFPTTQMTRNDIVPKSDGKVYIEVNGKARFYFNDKMFDGSQIIADHPIPAKGHNLDFETSPVTLECDHADVTEWRIYVYDVMFVYENGVFEHCEKYKVLPG